MSRIGQASYMEATQPNEGKAHKEARHAPLHLDMDT